MKVMVSKLKICGGRVFPPHQGHVTRVRRQALHRARASSDDDKNDVHGAALSSGGSNLPLVAPKLSYAFLAVSLTVFGVGIGTALSVSNEASNEYFLLLAMMSDKVAQGEYWRLLTSTFMHAGLLHLFLNTASLYFIGPEAEAVYGYRRFAAIYLLTGLSGSIASFLLTDLVTVGASGACFGLLGALVAYFARNPKLERAALQLLFLLAVVSFNFVLGADEGGMIDNTGHAAGFAAGLWLGWWLSPQWQKPPTSEPTLEQRLARFAPAPVQAAAEASAVDTLDSTVRPATAVASSTEVAASSSGADAGPTSTLGALTSLLPGEDQAPPPRPEAQPLAEPVLDQAADASSAGEGGASATAGFDSGQQAATLYVDGGNNTIRVAVVASFAFSLAVFTWAGTVERLAEQAGSAL